MSLRFFLKVGCLAVMLFSASLCFAEQKVIVVGAGLAGLTAGHRLQDEGYSVEVYEARSRPGGRVLTIQMGSSFDELGGKFLSDGGDAENIRSLISEMGLKVEEYEIDNSKRAYVYKGSAGPLRSAFLTGPVPSPQAYAQLQESCSKAKSIGDILDEFFQDDPLARHLVENRMRNYEGNDSKDLSTSYLDSFWSWYQRSYEKALTNKANVTIDYVQGGNSRLVEKLANSLEGHIHYNFPLRSLTKSKEGKIQLTFEGDRVVETDVLVLAIPCSTLRDVKIEEGIIPEDQLHAIETLQYGSNAKIAIPAQISLADFSSGENAAFWCDKDHRILTLYYGGSPGIFSTYSEGEVAGKIMQELPSLQMLDPSISFPSGLVPTDFKDEFFVTYDKPVGISWINEEFSKGSYSSFGVDQYEFFNEKEEAMGETVRTVFRPVDGKIFFAGEHTSLAYPGTMEAAVESGERTARMIAKEYP